MIVKLSANRTEAMDTQIFGFFVGAFTNAFDIFGQRLEGKIMTILEQISQLQAGQQITSQKIDELTRTSAEERTQVQGLVSVVQTQQSTIAELNAKIVELTAVVDVSSKENEAAVEAVKNLLVSVESDSQKIDGAIASIKSIYEPA